jgi:hypothetical protein
MPSLQPILNSHTHSSKRSLFTKLSTPQSYTYVIHIYLLLAPSLISFYEAYDRRDQLHCHLQDFCISNPKRTATPTYASRAAHAHASPCTCAGCSTPLGTPASPPGTHAIWTRASSPAAGAATRPSPPALHVFDPASVVCYTSPHGVPRCAAAAAAAPRCRARLSAATKLLPPSAAAPGEPSSPAGFAAQCVGTSGTRKYTQQRSR